MKTPSFLVLATVTALAACGGSPPPTLGPTPDGQLAPCPDLPNCVNTGDGYRSGIEGFELSSVEPDAFSRVVAIVEDMPRMSVVTATERYLHAEEHSRIFRFVDDLELLLVDTGELLVRSSSRLGEGDMGVNARRVERLRDRLREAGLLR